jgi:cell division protein FtsB
MQSQSPKPKFKHENTTHALALVCLLIMGALVVAGPSGLLAWSEHRILLKDRQDEVKQLITERERLRNRVALLNPRNADPDLAGELLRRNLNVVHPDEVVILLK